MKGARNRRDFQRRSIVARFKAADGFVPEMCASASVSGMNSSTSFITLDYQGVFFRRAILLGSLRGSQQSTRRGLHVASGYSDWSGFFIGYVLHRATVGWLRCCRTIARSRPVGRFPGSSQARGESSPMEQTDHIRADAARESLSDDRNRR